MLRRIGIVVVAAIGGVGALAGPAFAHECTNANKPAAAGAQVLIGPDDEIEWATPGLVKRFEHGLIGPDGEGFHGLVAIDVDGDGAADFSTYIVGPESELPEVAQFNGSPDHGIVNLCGTGCD